MNSRGSSFAACMGLCIVGVLNLMAGGVGGVCWEMAPCVYRVVGCVVSTGCSHCISRLLTLSGMLHGLLD